MASKTPTLAELRKLAKRKGFDIEVGAGVISAISFASVDFDVFFFEDQEDLALLGVFAALSALPDKERAR